MKFTKKTVLAIASFVLLLLQALGVRIDFPVVNEVICAGAGVLVMLGLISDSPSSSLFRHCSKLNNMDKIGQYRLIVPTR